MWYSKIVGHNNEVIRHPVTVLCICISLYSFLICFLFCLCLNFILSVLVTNKRTY